MTAPDTLTDLRCEACGAKMHEFTPVDESGGDSGSEFSARCGNCDRQGSATLTDGAIDQLRGDAFQNVTKPDIDKHHGWREEHSVLYKEHYGVPDDVLTDDVRPTGAIVFTRDSVHSGYDPHITYKCNCEREFDGRRDLSVHLYGVAQNRGIGAVSGVPDG